MIKTIEARVGNYFLWKGKIHDQVIRYYPNEKKELVELSGFILGQLLAYTPGRNFEELFLEPIPLTEEWLLKFGAEKVNDYLKLGFEYFYLRSNIIHWEQCEEKDMPIQYVHQLQNLYFALTGQELTLNSQPIKK